MKKKAVHKSVEEYRSMYIRKTAARLGKSLYIRQEYHERITQIISVIDRGEVTLYEYVDHVLTEHFKRYHEEMVDLFNDRRIY